MKEWTIRPHFLFRQSEWYKLPRRQDTCCARPTTSGTWKWGRMRMLATTSSKKQHCYYGNLFTACLLVNKCIILCRWCAFTYSTARSAARRLLVRVSAHDRNLLVSYLHHR